MIALLLRIVVRKGKLANSLIKDCIGFPSLELMFEVLPSARLNLNSIGHTFLKRFLQEFEQWVAAMSDTSKRHMSLVGKWAGLLVMTQMMYPVIKKALFYV